ncbi:hypothetical protein ISS03_01345 [Patescibacteria group bacterium]|nr:hypothetical protein [Patescibacteria group bacterium]
MLKNNLMQLGLSEKEASVYLAALQLGVSTVQKIALEARINRATTYVIIESLSKKGLMSDVEKDGKTYYSAEDPANLTRLLQKQKKEIDDKEKTLQLMLEELNVLYRTTGDRPVVRFFEGVEGTKTIRSELFKMKSKQTYGTTILDELYKAFPKHDEEMTKKRIKKGIESKVIYTSSQGKVADATSKSKLREARFVPYEFFGDTGTSITIFDNKISIMTYKNRPGGILIEDKNIAEFMKKLFELAWEGSSKYNK